MESVHDIYGPGSTARPLAVGDWVLLGSNGRTSLYHLVSIDECVIAANVEHGSQWNTDVPVESELQITEVESELILSAEHNEQWHRLTPAEAVAWMAEHLAGEETR